MSKLKPINMRKLNNTNDKTFTFTHEELITIIGALYHLEDTLDGIPGLSERADNVFEIDGYGYPSVDAVEELRERING